MTKYAHATVTALFGPDRRQRAIPVVGIGASAGGLDPICEFLVSVPAASGLAFVVVQHLDPLHKAMLPELLQRVTSMRVYEVSDGMAVEPDCVYVIPPNRDLELVHGVLALSEPDLERGHRMPIDVLFHSLARERGALAAGVVLSGMGSDGSCGLKTIKERGGLTLAQQPGSAKFDPMPQAAIDAGVVDVVALPRDMPEQIMRYWRPHAGARVPLQAAAQRDALQELFQLLLERTGANFVDYKLNTMLRRIDRRMQLHQFRGMDRYLAFLRANPSEVDLLFKELLIGVTSFFRDPKVWEHLDSGVLPALLAQFPGGLALKAWVPACSTGEEAYSLAIVFSEVVERLGGRQRYTLQIFATDLDGDAINRAREGLFTPEAVRELSAGRLGRCFVLTESGYQIRKELRNMIIFAQQNVVSDPPFTKLDLLCCRNLLIYFNHKLQERLIPLFHYALKPGGLLMLGSADTPGRYHELFEPAPGGVGRIYRRLDVSAQRPAHYFPTRASGVSPSSPSEARDHTMSGNLQNQIEQHLLKKHTPAAVLLNAQGDILYIHGRTGAYLEPAAGKANWNIHAMARDSLRYQLADLLKRASQTGGLIALPPLVLSEEDGRRQVVHLTAEAVGEGGQCTVLVTFSSVVVAAEKRRARSSNPRVQELEQQLAQVRLEIDAVRAEMQASREELQASNEELQSTNEELQSTNEELTTSKEEMQSLNEELYTVNAELQSKVDDLSLVNGDMKNLLNSTEIATIFLDGALCIRRYTDPSTEVYKLKPGDLHRPLGDIVTELDYPRLQADAQEVLRTLVFQEHEVSTASGRWFKVRIMPYRTVDNVIDGLVVTFINITDAKVLEARLRAVQDGTHGS